MNPLRLALAFVFALTASFARAHDAGLSQAEIRLKPDALDVTLIFAASESRLLLPSANPAGAPQAPLGFDEAKPQLLRVASTLCELRANGDPLDPRSADVQLAADDFVTFHLSYPRPSGPVTFRALGFDRLSPDHRQFAVVIDEQDSEIATQLLNADHDTIAFTLTATSAPAAAPTFAGFLRLGVEHIWTGYDHLLFLFALLVTCGSFRSIVTIISCFTLAHSLTLALATLDLVHLPARFVEPAIAASIVFVGLENLWRRGTEPRGRWALTFAFGLIHGFGFASVLRDLGVGAGGQGLAVPLVAFNLGVEFGQIAIAAIVLPLVWRLRRRERFVSVGIPALSSVVAAAGTYWLLERTVFS